MRISDWSSDVCSSDLKQIYISTCGRGLEPVDHVQIWLPFELPKENFGQLLESVSNYGKQFGITPFETCIVVKFVYEAQIAAVVENPGPNVGGNKIGRASCWERVCQYVSISGVVLSFKN